MTRRELANDMQRFFGTSFLSFQQIKQYTNYGRDTLKSKIHNVPSHGSGRKGKRYHVLDLVDVLWDDRKIS